MNVPYTPSTKTADRVRKLSGEVKHQAAKDPDHFFRGLVEMEPEREYYTYFRQVATNMTLNKC